MSSGRVSGRELAKPWNLIPGDWRDPRRVKRTMWCTPTKGLHVAAARVFAAFEHTLKQPAIPGRGTLNSFERREISNYAPGPLVYAIPSILFNVVPASRSAFLTAPGFRNKDQEWTSKLGCGTSCHVLLVGPNCIHRVYSSKIFVAAYIAVNGRHRCLEGWLFFWGGGRRLTMNVALPRRLIQFPHWS